VVTWRTLLLWVALHELCSPSCALCLSGATERLADHKSLDILSYCSGLLWKLQSSMCGAVLEQPFRAVVFVPCMLWRGHIRHRPWGAATLSQRLLVLLWYQG
jgi:hypothetical protein